MGLEVTRYIPDTHQAWVKWNDEARFKLAYVGTDEVEAVLLDKAQRSSLQSKNAAPADRAKMMIEYLAEAVVLDWEGVTKDGEDLECTKENVIDVLTKAKEIRDWVHSEASKVTNFKEYEDLKN